MKVATRLSRFAVIVCALQLIQTDLSEADELADRAGRKGKWEIMLAPHYTLAKNLAFDGGTTAKIEDTVGFNFQFGYNFNQHWNVGGLFSWSRPDYQAPCNRFREIPQGHARNMERLKPIRSLW